MGQRDRQLATESAAVAYDPERVEVDQLIQAVTHTGYGASLVRSQSHTLETTRGRPAATPG